MVSVQASRFALLKIDDDFIDEPSSPEKKEDAKSQHSDQKNKKKNKKKKKAANETQELRNMAFGGSSKGAKQRPKSGASDGKSKQMNGHDFDIWKKQDDEFTQQEYQSDLQKAILESKLQYEKQKLTANAQATDSAAKKKKKKQQDKRIPMTLDEFQQMQKEKERRRKQEESSSSEEEMPPAQPSLSTQVLDPDSKYFKGVSEEVMKILRKEQIQEKYKKQYAEKNVRTLKHQDDMEQKDEQLKALRKENKALKEELQEVKKRNKQLCVILAQGEMKDKSKILLELEELKQVRDEMTQEVGRLHCQLQKERSAKSSQASGGGGKAQGAGNGKAHSSGSASSTGGGKKGHDGSGDASGAKSKGGKHK